MIHSFAHILVVGLAFLVLATCGQKKSSSDGPAPDQSTQIVDPSPAPSPSATPSPTNRPLTFQDIDPILQARCAPCHSESQTARPVFAGHEDTVLRLKSSMIDRLTTKDTAKAMPPLPPQKIVTTAQKHQILVYLGKESLGSGESMPDYQQDIFPTFASKCAPCHTQNNKLGLPGFVGNEDLIKNSSNAIAARITATDSSVMPPVVNAASSLSDSDRIKILTFLGVNTVH